MHNQMHLDFTDIQNKYNALFDRFLDRREQILQFKSFLEKETTWLTSPASTRFHLSCEHGLLIHSVGVTYNAVCIEAKYESGEGSYPSSKAEKSIFDGRRLPRVRQIELQEYLMKQLLGAEAKCMSFVFNKKSPTDQSWAEVFGCLDMSGMPDFAKQMASKISG